MTLRAPFQGCPPAGRWSGPESPLYFNATVVETLPPFKLSYVTVIDPVPLTM